MRFNTLSDWLAWQETCHSKSIDLGLERVREAASRLGLLTPQATVITVAGTNGKGSCARSLDIMLRAAGHGVGVYSSPHILHYNERVSINGRLADDGALCAAFAAIDEARAEISLSYFEFGTLAALWLFAQNQCTHWVLEVGLGGRLDATNIIDADIAVITSIGLDHCDWLGDTREAIGREKAGICRAGRPVVIAEPDVPQSILHVVHELECPTYCINEEFYISPDAVQYQVGQTQVRIDTTLPPPSVAAAVQVMALLGEDLASSARALSGADLPGRLQRIAVAGKTVVLDVAHNPPAFEFLLKRLQQRFPGERFVMVLGMMADKDITQSLRLLAPLARYWVLCGLDGVARAATVDTLLNAAQNAELSAPVQSADTVEQGLAAALALEAGSVLVTGSFFTVAAGLEALASANEPQQENP